MRWALRVMYRAPVQRWRGRFWRLWEVLPLPTNHISGLKTSDTRSLSATRQLLVRLNRIAVCTDDKWIAGFGTPRFRMEAGRHINQAAFWTSLAMADRIFFPDNFAGLAARRAFQRIWKAVARIGCF